MVPEQKPSSASSSDALGSYIKQFNESYMQIYNNFAASRSKTTSRNIKPLNTFNFATPSLIHDADANSNRQTVRDAKKKKKKKALDDDDSTKTWQTGRDVKRKKEKKAVEDVFPGQQKYFDTLSKACSKLPESSIYGLRSLSPGISGLVPPTKSNVANTRNATPAATKRVKGVDYSTKNDTLYDYCVDMLRGPDGELPQKLRNIPHHLIQTVSNEIMENDPNVCWDDIAGLHHAKKCVTEMVVWPLLRPDVFKGCRSPGRGLLLFGPPGTGKTMIGKAIAGEANATFFYISASSLVSKWVGDGEKLVRALFGVASCRQPAVIFIDEIDSLLSQRKSDREQESSRRLKTQFFIEMEGFDSGNEQVLVIGATNRPQDLDEAARRRLTKRFYIPLPSAEARAKIVQNILEKDGLFKLATEDVDTICKLTEGYSGSDMKNLVKDASMGPLREAVRLGTTITNLKVEDMRRVTLKDFKDALQEVRPSVSRAELGIYEEWNNQFGSLPPSNICDLSQSCSTWSYDMLHGPDGKLPQKLHNIPRHLIETICNEIMDRDPNVRWDDIAGLHQAKKCATEMAILPLLHPDIFKGCRSPGRGLLLFGPPGTGKTMIGKAIAGEAKATFFYISASSLTSKWIGESEKLVRALFGVASCRQPAVIFVDEIDSMLSQRRSDGEREIYRRMKTQFFIEMEGFDSGSDQILLIGATNRPQELDEAARRRLTKRLYIPLPSSEARALIVRNLLEKDGLFNLSTEDVDTICQLTEGYSGSDMRNVVKDAAMGPVREALKQFTEGTKLKKEDMRPITLQDFEDALKEVRPSVSLDQIGIYEDWNNQFGSLLPSETCDSIQFHHPRKKMKTSAMGEYNTSSHAQSGNNLVEKVNEIPCPMDHMVAKRVGKAKVFEQTNGQVNGTYDKDIEISKGV